MHTTTQSGSHAELAPKMRQLAQMVAAKRPTPAQLEQICAAVAKETGHSKRTVKSVLNLALREGVK